MILSKDLGARSAATPGTRCRRFCDLPPAGCGARTIDRKVVVPGVKSWSPPRRKHNVLRLLVSRLGVRRRVAPWGDNGLDAVGDEDGT
jgi:hypothetical protein